MKKSTQSKRLAKRREKEKRKIPDGDNNKYDNHNEEVMFRSYVRLISSCISNSTTIRL